MARYETLSAILLIWGCGHPEPPTFPDLHLKPAHFEQVFEPGMVEVYHWALSPRLPKEIPRPRSTVPSEPGLWFTLSQDRRPRFLFRETNDFIHIYYCMGATHEWAQIPLPLRAGMTWTSSYNPVPGLMTPIQQWGSCTSERLTLKTGTYDALRVDFSLAGQVQHSLCFTPNEGLIQWAGIERTPVSRANYIPPEDLLRTAAKGYPVYGRVVDWTQDALVDCEVSPSIPLMSASQDRRTHGGKLYSLFAKDRQAYLSARDKRQPEGQIVVKESWYPGKERPKGPLFMMLKFQGDWIYATATSDGAKITESGKIASCMRCHEHGPHDKVFGLAEPPMSIDNCRMPEQR